MTNLILLGKRNEYKAWWKLEHENAGVKSLELIFMSV
jgi:hypothetical protein